MEVLASWSGRFTPGEGTTGAHCVEGFVSSTLTLGKLIRRQNCSLAGTERSKITYPNRNIFTAEVYSLTVTIIMPCKLSHSVNAVEMVVLRVGEVEKSWELCQLCEVGCFLFNEYEHRER